MTVGGYGLILFLLFCLAFLTQCSTSELSIPVSTISAGGGRVQGGNITLDATLSGLAGTSSAGTVVLRHGIIALAVDEVPGRSR